MAIIAGVIVNWQLSPRVIIIPNSEIEITIRDLQDTLLDLEDDTEGILHTTLRETSGGEDLGGGVFVNLTMELQNAVLAPEPRLVSKSTGTATSNDTVGQTLTDNTATFISDGVLAGASIMNLTDGSVTSIFEIISETEILHFTLEDGSDNEWGIGDSYKVWNEIQFDITGGNLVGVDGAGDPTSPIRSTFGNEILKTASTSASLIESDVSGLTPSESTQLFGIPSQVWDVEIADHLTTATTGNSMADIQFGGSVCINTASGNSGTTFPNGTKETPVDNLVDALAIATVHGLRVLDVNSALTVAAGEDISGYTITSDIHATITLATGSLNFFTNFNFIDLAGDINGFVIINDSSIDPVGVTEFYGIMDRVTIRGPIEISSDSSNNAVFLDCFTGAVSGPTVIDLNGDGAKCSLRGLTGAALFTNKTGSTQPSFIDLYSARVGFDNTVTAGAFTIRGVGYIYQDDSSNATFDTRGLMSKETIGVAVWDEVLNGSTHNIASSAGRRLRQLSSGVIFEGVSAGPGTNGNQIVLSNDSASTDGAYDPAAISITEGTGVGQSRLILEYEGATRTATVDRDWKTAPDTSSVFVITASPGREHVNEGLAQGGTTNTITLNANASIVDDTYVRQIVFIRSGTGQDQVGRVNSYDGTTKIATVEFDWSVVPDTTSAYVMLASHNHTPLEMAAAVWDEAKEDHNDEGSFAEHIKRIRNNKV